MKFENYSGYGLGYKITYKEQLNEKTNTLKLVAEMNIDLNKKSGVNKANKSFRKGKSPLLDELQTKYRENKSEPQEIDFYELNPDKKPNNKE